MKHCVFGPKERFLPPYLRASRRLLDGLVAIFIALFSTVVGTIAQASASDECLEAIRFAAQETGVPAPLLLAVAKVETGRAQNGDIQPWPWAINIRGVGHWLSNKEELLERALEKISKSETRFDVGCFQLNYRWHGEAFVNLDEMISPRSNTLYAANFLKSLFVEFGDWTTAVGAYHSRTETLAQAYRNRISQHYDPNETISVAAPLVDKRPASRKPNSYPLLQTVNLKTRLGSLVPSETQ